jgi:ABC-type Zn uptake system ZnuABC Zn-binding protein ZnuA
MNPPKTWLTALLLLVLAPPAAAESLKVVATVPDLGALARTVGGDAVTVTVLAKGPQDPHSVEPRPSFIRKLHDADLYLEVGMELELGWSPVLLRGARNSDILPGRTGYLSASTAIRPLQVPVAPVDRSMGDIHIYGNPHFLVDPVRGLRVAALVRDKMIELRPAEAEGFRERYERFEKKLVERLVGIELASRVSPAALIEAVESDRLDALADREGAPVKGWLGEARKLSGVRAVEDHQAWVYFADRFGLQLVETLEPQPGIAPTARHLREVVETMSAREARVILASPYFDPRHAGWVSERTGAGVAAMAHQIGSREGADDYLSMIEYNLRQVLAASEKGEAPS